GAGVSALLGRALDWRRITAKRWYVPTLLLAPGVMVLTYGLMRWMGRPLPEAPEVPLAWVLVLLPVFLVAASCEELGWSVYAIEPLQDRWGALRAALMLGGVWAAWHLVPLLQARRPRGWIVGWCLATLASRVLIVWIYNNTGKSVFAASFYHAVSNLSWMSFPNQGSHYDPRVAGPILALAAALVAVVWGPRTLVRWGSA